MPTIYRIQDSDGRGPWKPGFSHVWSDLDNKSLEELERLQPMFFVPPRGVFCGVGCKTLNQLRLWFNQKEYATLLSLGYKCVRLKVDRILVDTDVQSAFARKRPLKVGAVEVRLFPELQESSK